MQITQLTPFRGPKARLYKVVTYLVFDVEMFIEGCERCITHPTFSTLYLSYRSYSGTFTMLNYMLLKVKKIVIFYQ